VSKHQTLPPSKPTMVAVIKNSVEGKHGDACDMGGQAEDRPCKS